MQKYTTVIEITSQWLKLLAVKPSLKGPEIVDLTLKPVGSISTEGLAGEFSAVVKGLKFIPSPLIVSFPRNLVTMRNLHLPSADPKEIGGMIDLHMARQVPYPRDEIVGGYQVLGVDDLGYTKVMLAIAHREALRRIFGVLNNVNIFPERVELSSEGVLSWFLFSQKAKLEAGQLYLLLDIDSNFTDFMIVDRENLLFSRNIGSGAEQILIEEIRRIKFIPEIKQSLVIFQSEEMNKKPAKIFISGITANIAGLAALLEAEFNIKTEVVKPPENIAGRIPKNVSISALLGLALEIPRKRITFILPEIQVRRSLEERSREIIALGSLLMFIFIVTGLVFLAKTYNRTGYKKLLTDKYEDVGGDVEKLEEMSKKSKIIKERLETRAYAINCLYQINKLMPAEIVLKTLTFEADDKITLRGQAQAMSDVYKFNSTLEKSGYFKDIQIKFQTRKRIAERDISEFEIVCPIQMKTQLTERK